MCFPLAGQYEIESLYFNLHYKYMFYNICYTCALYVVFDLGDISYLTLFCFVFVLQKR